MKTKPYEIFQQGLSTTVTSPWGQLKNQLIFK